MYKNDLPNLGTQKSLQVYFETTMEKQLLSKITFKKMRKKIFTLIKGKNINLNMQFTEKFQNFTHEFVYYMSSFIANMMRRLPVFLTYKPGLQLLCFDGHAVIT